MNKNILLKSVNLLQKNIMNIIIIKLIVLIYYLLNYYNGMKNFLLQINILPSFFISKSEFGIFINILVVTFQKL